MKWFMFCISVFGILFILQFISSPVSAQGKLSSRVALASGNEDQLLVWITFKDKGNLAVKQSEATRIVSPRAIQRRSKMMPLNKLIDDKDYPVETSCVQQVEQTGVTIRQQSRWFNAVSAWVSREQLRQIEKLNCVANIDLVMRLKKSANDIEFKSSGDKGSSVTGKSTGIETIDYGTSFTQNNQINVPAVHNLGIYGQGVMIAVFDAGFNNLGHEAFDSMNIVATHDFVNGDSSVADDPGQMGEGSHGTNTLSVCGGYKPGQLIGPSFRAAYVLAKTENTESETPVEEDNWIAAMEWAEGYGVDIISCSLGYIGFDGQSYYDWTWMNGDSCRITKAADMATWRGVVVVNSAGNEDDDPSHNTLGAPSDGDTVIAAGAVTSSGTRSSFSSVGPTVDGRIKPDVMAMGSGVRAASAYSTTDYSSVNGTSFSCPLTAGVCGLILSANPNLTPYQVREALRNTASQSGSPDKYYGWGIVNALNAVNYYRAVITHTPMTDTENLTGPYTINATITSTMTIDSVTLVYGINGLFDQTVIMNHTGNNYYADISGTGVPTTYNYYVKVKNTLGLISYEPKNAPSVYHSFTASADTVKPVITHTPMGNQGQSMWPTEISSTVTDNIGVDSVLVEFSHNGVVQNSFVLVREGLTTTFSSHFPNIPVVVGDYIDYRIIAIDQAGIPNSTVLPSMGYYRFYISSLSIFSSDLNTTSGGLTGNNDWEWGAPSGSSPLPHSAPKVWATKLATNYTDGPLLSKLTLPQLTATSDNASISFWQAYEMEDGYDGGNLKVSINSGAYQIINPSGGYPESSLSTSWDNPIGGEPAFSGTALSWQQITFPLNGIVHSGDQVSIRFDFGADNGVVKLGWYIDDFTSVDLGSITTDINDGDKFKPNVFTLEQNYPNPFNPSTTIRYQIPANEKVTLKIFNTLGQEVRTLVNAKQNAGSYSIQWDGKDVQGRTVSSGIYIYRLKAGNDVKSQKMMLIR